MLCEGETCTVRNVLHGCLEDKRTNNRTISLALKNDAAAGYKGPVKTQLLNGAGLLCVNAG